MTRAGTAPGSTLCPAPPCGDKPRTPWRDRDTPDPLPPPLRVPSPSSRAGRIFGVPRGWREAAPPFIPSEPPKATSRGTWHIVSCVGSLGVCLSVLIPKERRAVPPGGASFQRHIRTVIFLIFFHLAPLQFQPDFYSCLKRMVIPCFELTQRIFWGGESSPCPDPAAGGRAQGITRAVLRDAFFYFGGVGRRWVAEAGGFSKGQGINATHRTWVQPRDAGRTPQSHF